MNKIKSLMKKIKTVFGNVIIRYHAKIAYMSLDEINIANFIGDVEARKRWEKRYIKHGLKVPELKDDIQDWLNRNK